jgi:hypothetical protein
MSWSADWLTFEGWRVFSRWHCESYKQNFVIGGFLELLSAVAPASPGNRACQASR